MRIAYIGMGANLPSHAGPPAVTLRAAAARLTVLGRILRRSSLYSTAPVGLADQPHFVNAVVALETSLSPLSLLEGLLAIEHEFGRDRSAGVPNGPRTLDLDILMLGDIHLSASDLEIPHPRLAERAFVLIPLHEIAPQAVDPRRHATVAELLDCLHSQSHTGAQSVVPVRDPLWDADAGGPPSQPGAGGPDRHG
jgi:2-amino-4-hydroxy-6-hydroxymethyldihydropteridine diphosphokinase